MKFILPVKQVIDYNLKPRVKSDGTGDYLANVKMSVNPFDEIVVEQAFRLRERRVATEVIAASIGPDKAQEALHTASRDQGGAEPVAVAIFVAQQNLGVGQSVEHPHCGFMVTHLAVGEQHRDGATFAVSHGMEF